MSIEGGARAGLMSPDEKTFSYIKDRPRSPKGDDFDRAVDYWNALNSDKDAYFDRDVYLDAAALPPVVTWGTSPEDVVSINGEVPDPEGIDDEIRKETKKSALEYMDLKPGTKIKDIELDVIFIGSCTNGRIEDLREVAKVVEGHHVNENLNAMIVPRIRFGKGKQ